MGDIQPTFIHTIGLYEIGEAKIDVAKELGILTVLIVLRRHDDQTWTGLASFPIGLACLYACLLRQLTLRQYDAMALFCGTAHGNGFSTQLWIQHHFDTCVEAVGITVQNTPLLHAYTSRCS